MVVVVSARALQLAMLLVAGLGYGAHAARVRAAPPEPPAGPAELAPVVGVAESAIVEDGDTLLDVAARHRLGFERLARMNPGVDEWIPNPGTVVRLPTRHVLPGEPRRGLVVNLPEMQLYDFTQPGGPEVFAVAIGDEMDPSLLGEFKVGVKRERPAWHVPKSILEEKPELPPIMPPGPDNPLGDHWMTIGSTTYGIHGTNNRWSIGREATHGCLRLYNEDIARLYARTPVGTRIRLVYEPVKLGVDAGSIWVEAHPDRYGRDPDRLVHVLERLDALGLRASVDVAALRRAIEEARGEPIAVGRLESVEATPAETGATSTPTS